MAAIDAFLFDIGNVLVGFDFDPALKILGATCGRAVDDCRPEIDELKNRYESGQIDRRQFLIDGVEILEYRGSHATFESTWQRIFFPNDPMHQLVRHLKQSHPLYLLSNTSDLHMDHLREAYDIFHCFTGGTYSWLVGCMKPFPQIYHEAIRAHGLTPARTVFIDDLPQNVDAARKLGFQAHLYDMHQHARLLDWLRQLGVNLPA